MNRVPDGGIPGIRGAGFRFPTKEGRTPDSGTQPPVAARGTTPGEGPHIIAARDRSSGATPGMPGSEPASPGPTGPARPRRGVFHIEEIPTDQSAGDGTPPQDQPPRRVRPVFHIQPLDDGGQPDRPEQPQQPDQLRAQLHIPRLNEPAADVRRQPDRDTEYAEARDTYRSHVEANPTLEPWYGFLQQAGELQERGDTEGLSELGERITFAYSRVIAAASGGQVRPEAVQSLLPGVTWVQDPGIHRVTGHNFALPVMEFDASNIELYAALHGGKINQGVSSQIPAELLGLPRGSRPVSLLALPSEEFDRYMPMPHDQRRRHELMHSVDPNIRNRHGLESLIQTEMLATLGELTHDNLNNGATVNTPPGFWLNYLRTSPQTRPFATIATAQRITDHIRAITGVGNVRMNDEIVRDLMLTRGNKQLRDVINPPIYPQPGFEITIDL